jgi:hypothetical protein
LAIATGATRHALLIGGVVVKVPIVTAGWYAFLWGLLSNMNEASVWAQHRGHFRLCPTLWASPGGWLNVMARAEPLPEGWVWCPAMFAGLTEDLDDSNVGRWGDRVVAIDYA